MAETSTSKTYGSAYAEGFARFKASKEFSDVRVVTELGEDMLHGMLLANRSTFFLKALTSDFHESRTKVIELLHLDKAVAVWPLLVDFFYTDTITVTEDNVLALMALSRQLLVACVDTYCSEFVRERLSVENCLRYLKEAVKYHIHDVQADCVTLAARGFHFLYNSDVAGLPPTTVLDILRHNDLLVHCEAQVLHFVLKYLASTSVEPDDVRTICQEVRFCFLDNQVLASLSKHALVPQDMLLEGCTQRLLHMDNAAQDYNSVVPGPRTTYCSDPMYGLPGGCSRMTVEVEAIWEHIARLCTVRVSGASEGHPEAVISAEPDAWFETNDSADPLPWIEIQLPGNVRIVNFHRYTFAHGHRRSGYYRMRNWKTMAAATLDGTFTDLYTRVNPNEQFEVQVAPRDQEKPWQVLRLVGTERQEDSVWRLCVRNLRVYGLAEVDLMHQAGGLVVSQEVMARVQRRR